MIESKKVKFATIKFKSGSLAWWQLVQQKRRVRSKEPIRL